MATDVVCVPGRMVPHGARVRPLQPGAEVGHLRGGRGTLGLIVRKIGQATPLVLSCSHVLARSGAIDGFGRSVEQPTGDAGEVVGVLTDDFSRLRSTTLATDDVALAQVSAGTQPGLLDSGVVPARFDPRLAKELNVGEPTTLHGLVSSGATGRVAAFESTWDIAEMPFVNGHVEFSGLVGYETRSEKGDSGGVVMSGVEGTRDLVLGIHTAGRSDGQLGLFQPIGPVFKRLGIELVPARLPGE